MTKSRFIHFSPARQTELAAELLRYCRDAVRRSDLPPEAKKLLLAYVNDADGFTDFWCNGDSFDALIERLDRRGNIIIPDDPAGRPPGDGPRPFLSEAEKARG